VLISVGGWVDPMAMSMKNPQTPAGIEPAAFRFVAQHLSDCATAVPLLVYKENLKPMYLDTWKLSRKREGFPNIQTSEILHESPARYRSLNWLLLYFPFSYSSRSIHFRIDVGVQVIVACSFYSYFNRVNVHRGQNETRFPSNLFIFQLYPTYPYAARPHICNICQPNTPAGPPS